MEEQRITLDDFLDEEENDDEHFSAEFLAEEAEMNRRRKEELLDTPLTAKVQLNTAERLQRYLKDRPKDRLDDIVNAAVHGWLYGCGY